ncbi:MAG: tetratricopeptide repeat protein [Pseudomonadota bacterium]
MGLVGRRSGVCAFAVVALCGAQLTASPALADAPTTSPTQTQADFETALSAYQSGDVDRALRLGRIAAENGSLEASVLCGHILRHGETGTPDPAEARRFYEMAAARNHPDALVALGDMGLSGEAGLTEADAYAYLLRASDAGRNDATLALADMNRTGRGIAPDIDEERRLLERASAAFDSEATKRLADTYLETDPKRALDLYEQAAGAGHAEAAYAAGVMYAQTFEIQPDEEKSAYWMAQAARAGHAAAQADFGLLVYQGAGVPRNAEDAADWFRRSAENGDSEGMFLYAFTLAKGDGVEQDFGEAYYWLLRAGDSTVDDYQQDRATLRQRLEDNVDPDILTTARARIE